MRCLQLLCLLSALWLIVLAAPLDGEVINNKTVWSQKRLCGTHPSAEDITAAEAKFKALRSRRIAFDSTNIRLTQSPTFNILLHVIVANETYEGGWIPDSQIAAQIQMLNNDYAQSGIAWNLAGVQRVQNENWFLNVDQATELEHEMKSQLRTGGPDTLNIYTVSFKNATSSNLLGFSYLPGQSDLVLDGIVLRYTTLPGGSQEFFNLGHVLTHEVGHWLGLYHSFEGGCTGIGDQVDDTPPQREGTSGCPIFRDTCRSEGLDLINNFMDYSIDLCMDTFTPGQIERMHEQVLVYRSRITFD
ncbi:hypothetical protein AX17_006678 [Amanita inopinata Kibby_2008]|nr:hypothetical protein AX17_006678 [Amanita inopinata Kibby_2008]